MYDILIRHAEIADGTGAALYTADVAVQNGRIAAIGAIENVSATKVIDASGLTLTPGFIDMHSHADLSIFRYPDAENLLGQGITTAFTGHCGMGMAPVGRWWKTQTDDLYALEEYVPLMSVSSFPGVTATVRSAEMRKAFEKYYDISIDWDSFEEYLAKLEKQGTGINLVMEIGLQQIRQDAVGIDMDRPATDTEIAEMEAEVEKAMQAGARGLSIGYDYTPDMFASEKELDAVCRVVKKYDGIVTAHTRNSRDDDKSFEPGDGIREFLEIGKRTGVRVHISHIGPAHVYVENDEKKIAEGTNEILDMIEEYRAEGVRVTWDVLHPEAASIFYDPELCAPFQYYILSCGGKRAFSEKLKDETYRRSFVSRISEGKHIRFPRFTPDAVVTGCRERACIGKKLTEIAEERSETVYETAAALLALDVDTTVLTKMPWERIFFGDGFWLRDDASIGTDNSAVNYDYEGRAEDLPHMRAPAPAYSGFITYLERSAEHGVTFEKTIRKLTKNAADILQLPDRGTVSAGMRADLVLLNRTALSDNRSFIDPRQAPRGIEYVLVNGRVAVEHGKHTHVRSGEICRWHAGDRG